jgi:hypothetical protein
MKALVIISLVVLVLLVSAIIACSNVLNSPLPHAMKGYELYSWQEEGEWRFSLLTGTNRNKNLEEITSSEDRGIENGWVNLHAAGVDELKTLLSRLPEGEFVFWNNGPFVILPEGTDSPLALPPAEIIDILKVHAEPCGLDLNVTF